jgi:hypothetical protein
VASNSFLPGEPDRSISYRLRAEEIYNSKGTEHHLPPLIYDITVYVELSHNVLQCLAMSHNVSQCLTMSHKNCLTVPYL